MNEYIKLCEEAHRAGQDFTDASVHTGARLPFRPHHYTYLNEKLNCIYGVEFQRVDAAEHPDEGP
jgi:hypothetical protein